MKTLKMNDIPVEILDFVRFMCKTWNTIDTFVYENCDPEDILRYPIIQGTKNQRNLIKIGEQKCTVENINKAVKWMLEESQNI